MSELPILCLYVVGEQPLQRLGQQPDQLYQGEHKQSLGDFLQLPSVNLIYHHHGEDEVIHALRWQGCHQNHGQP